MKHVFLFSDGACSGNPGPGGWGVILRYNDTEKELSGGEAETTNNRMELTAVIKGLNALRFPCRVTVTSDSKYVCDAINQNWLSAWVKNGWKKADRKPVLNTDLWMELLRLMEIHSVEFLWIKGHAGHPENERCDKLAVAAYQQFL